MATLKIWASKKFSRKNPICNNRQYNLLSWDYCEFPNRLSVHWCNGSFKKKGVVRMKLRIF